MVNYKEFYKGFERCPICGGEMINYNGVIIKKRLEIHQSY